MTGSGFVLRWCVPGTNGADLVVSWGPFGTKRRAVEAAKRTPKLSRLEAWVRGPKGGMVLAKRALSPSERYEIDQETGR